jgi:hypothetical protein
MDLTSETGREQPRICFLTGVTDDHYRSQRSDDPVVCTSAGKRLQLYKAFTAVAGAAPLLLSPHSRGRGKATSWPALETRFGDCVQLFSAASGIRKVRVLIDMIRYAGHVYRCTRDGDVLIFDNYELIYVLALRYCRIRGRVNPIILEYEDGKHAIDRGWPRWISWLAELLGRPLLDAAIVATPALLDYLPDQVPAEVVPGLLRADIIYNPAPADGGAVHFLYSGSLDVERGAPLLLEYLASPLIHANVVFHITGQGRYSAEFIELMELYPSRICFHGCVSVQELDRIRGMCHYGLNLQSSANPISRVTFPSKTFDYINAGLRVVSTRASGVWDVLGDSAIYLETESTGGLADAVNMAAGTISTDDGTCATSAIGHYSFDGTVRRLRDLLTNGSRSAYILAS